jgi:hypothetical protein
MEDPGIIISRHMLVLQILVLVVVVVDKARKYILTNTLML